MKTKWCLPIVCSVCILSAGMQTWAEGKAPLRKIDEADLSIVEAYPPDDALFTDRTKVLRAIDHSLAYLRTATAAQKYPVLGISRERMEASLLRFRHLVIHTATMSAFREAILEEFDFYQASGRDQQGNVLFTGYYEPFFPASRQPTQVYRYPLYRLPPNFAQWQSPHPTRKELETSDRLKGLELVWLKDPLQAFLVHVQGSAKLQLPDGKIMTVGYAGKTDRPYTSLGASLVQDGKLTQAEVTLPTIQDYFAKHPAQLQGYLHRNASFVFFRETQGKPATGSIGVPVTAERSIATDKALMPPGGIALLRTYLPFKNPKTNVVEWRSVSRFVLDQDAGGAIKGAGRVDIFLGSGLQAEERAGILKSEGTLYYLVLKKFKQG